MARQEKYEEALAEFLKASKLAPLSARIQNNLGYVYLIQGRNSEALATLQIASRLDPTSERVRENVKTAEQRLSLVDAAANAPLARPIVADRLPQAIRTDSDVPRLVNVAPNIYELRQGLSMQLARNVSYPNDLGQLEVANGSGVPGLAKRTTSLLRKKGITVAHMTNPPPYNQTSPKYRYPPRSRESCKTHQRAPIESCKAGGSRPVAPERQVPFGVGSRFGGATAI